MDNLCHTLTGAALGKAGLADKTRWGMATLMVAANLPDVDVAVFLTDTLPMSFRRGWTHGVLAQATLPLALAGVVWAMGQRSTGKRPAFKPLLLLAYVGLYSHILMDWLNSYGVRLLKPFSDRWFYGDALYIVDPWLWGILGAGVWVASDLARAGRDPGTRFMVTPVPVNPFRREVLVDTGDRYEKGTVWFEPSPHFRPAGYGVDKGLSQPEVAGALAAPRAQAYLRWSRFPFVVVDRTTSPPRVLLNDYRYSDAGARIGWALLGLDISQR